MLGGVSGVNREQRVMTATFLDGEAFQLSGQRLSAMTPPPPPAPPTHPKKKKTQNNNNTWRPSAGGRGSEGRALAVAVRIERRLFDFSRHILSVWESLITSSSWGSKPKADGGGAGETVGCDEISPNNEHLSSRPKQF